MKDIKTLCRPVWKQTEIIAEGVTFVRDEKGRAFAPLLYLPEKVHAVTDARETVVYEEGVDYTVCEKGITLTENSRIYCFTHDELYPEPGPEGHFFPGEKGNVLFHEGHFFHDRQAAVSYTTAEKWTGHRPADCRGALARSLKLLEEGKPLSLCIFGDSISVGANASGFTEAEPGQPPYAGLFAAALEQIYGSSVTLTNNSVGGKDSRWGAETAVENAACCKPDLCVIAFGGNDGPTPPEVFAENIRSIIAQVRAASPECDLILIATSTPNPELCTDAAKFWGNQCIFAPELYAIAAETESCAVCNVTAMQASAMLRKRFIDMTGNNVNHPNDFFHRMHAQYLLDMYRAYGE